MAAAKKTVAAVKRRRRRRTVIKPAAGIDALSMMVGQLIGKLDQHIETAAAEREEATEYRRNVSTTLDEIKKQITPIVQHGTDIDALKKTAGDYRGFRNKIAGGVFAFGLIWVLVGDSVKAAVKGALFGHGG